MIQSYLDQFDPAAARRISDKLFGAGESLRAFPNRGRTDHGTVRELAIVPPCVLRYEVIGDEVLIFSVRHGRQDREA